MTRSSVVLFSVIVTSCLGLSRAQADERRSDGFDTRSDERATNAAPGFYQLAQVVTPDTQGDFLHDFDPTLSPTLPFPQPKTTANGAPPVRTRVYDLGVQADRATSEHYEAQYFSVSGDIPVGNRDHLLIDYHRLTREFKAGPTLTDQGTNLGYIYVFPRSAYLETSLSYNPQAYFMPRESLTATPHLVESFFHREFDLSLGVIASRYESLRSFTLHPKVFETGDRYFASAGLFVTRTLDTMFSGDVSVGAHFSHEQKIAFTFAAGRTLEDEGVETNFHSFAFVYNFRLLKNLYLGPSVQLFRGDIRSEDNYSLRLDVKL